MEHRELIGRVGDGLQAFGHRMALVDEVEQAAPLHELPDHERTPATRESPEPEHARRAEALETRERYRLADEGLNLTLGRLLTQALQSHRAPAQAIAHCPNLATAPLSERGYEVVSRRQLELGHDGFARDL